MNQQMASDALLRQHRREPGALHGARPALQHGATTATAQSAANVIDAGGVGAVNTSIWVVVWGPNTMHCLFPKGQISGLQHRDLGEWTLTDAVNNQYQGYRTHFKWDMGFTLRDWRYAVRICNIDAPALQTGAAANLINGLIRAVHRLPTAPRAVSTVQTTDAPDKGAMSMGRTAIYCNKVVGTYLDIQALNKTNVLLRYENGTASP
jgi:hypothetical protein